MYNKKGTTVNYKYYKKTHGKDYEYLSHHLGKKCNG